MSTFSVLCMRNCDRPDNGPLDVKIIPQKGLTTPLKPPPPKPRAPKAKPKITDKPINCNELDESNIGVKIPDQVVLHRRLLPGTPLDKPGKLDPRNQASVRLEKPMCSLDAKRGVVKGSARLIIDDFNYPKDLSSPTEIDIYIDSEPVTLDTRQIPTVSVKAFNSAFHADFKLKTRFAPHQTVRAATAGLGSLAAGEGIGGLLKTLPQPGLDMSGVVQLVIGKNLPVIKKIFRTKFSISVPPQGRLKNPLSGAPTAYRMRYQADGMVIIPPGAIFTTAAPGWGHTSGRWDESSGRSLSIAGLAVPSLSNLGEVSLYLYLDYYRVWRVGNGWDIGVRLSFAPSKTITLFGKNESQDETQTVQLWRDQNHHALDPTANTVKPLLLGTIKLTKNW